MPDRRSLPRVPDVAGDPSSQLLSSPVSAVTSAPSYLLRLPPSISVTSMDCGSQINCATESSLQVCETDSDSLGLR